MGEKTIKNYPHILKKTSYFAVVQKDQIKNPF